MILVDTSVWINHFHKNDVRLARLLEEDSVYTHPFIIGELACGNINNRTEILNLIQSLPKIQVANYEEILYFVEKNKLFGRGLGYIDVHLVASCIIANARLYTHDKKLANIAIDFSIN